MNDFEKLKGVFCELGVSHDVVLNEGELIGQTINVSTECYVTSFVFDEAGEYQLTSCTAR